MQKVRGLRVLMLSYGVEAYVVPSGDAHSSEYVARRDERRAWLTGFTGSAGIAVVNVKGDALLWTDGRYFEQASKQLVAPWRLMRQNEDIDMTAYCSRFKRVGIDPSVATLSMVCEIGEDRVVPLTQNLVDILWSHRRPAASFNSIEAVDGGEECASKLRRLRAAMHASRLSALCLNALDQIAWLFNLRGSDIECNPVFYSYALVTLDSCFLFTARDVPRDALPDEIVLCKYSEFGADELAKLVGDGCLGLERGTATLAMRPKTGSVALLDVSPVERFKASKNSTEIRGLRAASKRDSAVLCGFFAWLEERVINDESPTELEAATEISRRRRKFAPTGYYRGDSFETISASGSNAAIIHYRPTGEMRIDKHQLYLCDTGAQYLDGTTDITRTVAFTPPTDEQRACYTRVLQGHLDLARCVFPQGTPGIMLDAIARAPLWRDGLNYLHGTGHGMGAYLNVHEGPFGVGGGAHSASTLSHAAKLRYLDDIRPGFFFSDEPGFYKDGDFGIRLESDLLVVPAQTRFGFGDRPFLAFDYLTLVPMCPDLISLELLDQAQLDYLNRFHSLCRDQIEPLLDAAHMDNDADAERAQKWLHRVTRPL